MVNEQRKNAVLYKHPDNSLNNITIVMNTPGTDEGILRLTFRTRKEAYNSETGTEDHIRNKLAEIIVARLQTKNIAVREPRLDSGYIVLNAQQGSAQASATMFKEADEVMAAIAKLASQGVNLKGAMDKVLAAEKAVLAGQPRKEVKAEFTLDAKTAKAVIMKTASLMLPATAADASVTTADAFATAMAEQVTKRFPARPEQPRNEDPKAAWQEYHTGKAAFDKELEAMVQDACKAIPEAGGKRKYAGGAIYDDLQVAYDNLGKPRALVAVGKR